MSVFSIGNRPIGRVGISNGSTQNDEPDIVEREDGSLLIDGAVPAHLAFDRLGVRADPEDGDFHTVAGFALDRLRQLPEVGEHFSFKGWRFEVVDMDGRRIDKLLAQREPEIGSARV